MRIPGSPDSRFRRNRETSKTKLRPAALTLKEHVAIAISLMALTVSGLTFYFSNVRVKDDLQVRLVRWTGATRPSTDDFMVSLAIVNAGNRSAILERCHVLIDPRETDIKEEPARTTIKVDNVQPDYFPIMIPAHDMRLVSFRIPWTTISNRFLFPAIDPNEMFYDLQPIEVQFHVFGIDSSGTSHHAVGPTVQIMISPVGYVFGRVNSHAVRLF